MAFTISDLPTYFGVTTSGRTPSDRALADSERRGPPRSHHLRDFASDCHGATAVIFGLMAFVLFGLVGAAVDFTRWADARAQTMNALDAAVLAGGRALQTNGADGAKALAVARAYYTDATKSRLSVVSDTVDFSIGDNGTSVSATGSASIKTPFLKLVSIDTLPIINLSGADSAKAVVAVGANAKANFEVSMILDLSGSMGVGSKMADLRAAAKDLVNIIVWDDQSEYTSKVAIVPYATAVNVGSYAQSVRGSYTNGSTCSNTGCQYFRFTNAYGQKVTNQISNCVSERTGTQAYTDAAPNTAPVGLNYPSVNNPCSTSAILPLTSDKNILASKIDGLSAGGSTGGQIGVAWGWYLLSPNWAYLWPASSRPAAYGTKDLKKIAVLMTDGEYNSSYCQGVISYDSTSGSGSPADQINCHAPNGGSYAQSEKLCTAMKDAGVTVYTIGFNVVDSPSAVSLLKNCASGASNFYDAADGQALRNAFRDIALKISTLYLSQ